MSEYEMQDLEYDNTDLGQTSGQYKFTSTKADRKSQCFDNQDGS